MLPVLPVLWRPIFGTVDQRVSARDSYWWENRGRDRGQCVVQITHEGVLRYQRDGHEIRVGAGDALLFQHGEASVYGTDPTPHAPYRCDWVCLEGAGLAEHWTTLVERFGPVVPADGALVAGVRRLVGLCTSAAPGDPTVSAAACHAFVLQLWRAMADRQRTIRSKADQAVDAMLADPFLPWSLKEWAEHFGISREHLCRTFTARTGQSPSTWIAERKRERARRLVQEASLPVRDILALTGITSRFALRRLMQGGTPTPEDTAP